MYRFFNWFRVVAWTTLYVEVRLALGTEEWFIQCWWCLHVRLHQTGVMILCCCVLLLWRLLAVGGYCSGRLNRGVWLGGDLRQSRLSDQVSRQPRQVFNWISTLFSTETQATNWNTDPKLNPETQNTAKKTTTHKTDPKIEQCIHWV